MIVTIIKIQKKIFQVFPFGSSCGQGHERSGKGFGPDNQTRFPHTDGWGGTVDVFFV